MGCVSTSPAQSTDPSTTTLDALVVKGRVTDLVGSAISASQGSVGYLELSARPFLRRGELLEVIPGVVVTQHSGGGKANQYFLRGFNLDHGTDFSLSVDGLPVNMRSHAHGQGYADLNFIIPEFVQSVDYTKGPFSADVGDFSAAGAAAFHLFKALPEGFATVEVGEHNYARVVVGETIRNRAGAATTLGFEATHDDGPWDLPENLRRLSGIARQAWTGANEREFMVTAMAYQAKWTSTDQVPARAVASGFVGRFGNIDPTDGGQTERVSVSADVTARSGDWVTQINLYAIYYRLNLFSNFTYFFDDPVNGDQFNQRDERGVLGASLEQRGPIAWSGLESELTVGAQARADVIDGVALTRTSSRQIVGTVREDDVRESSIGLYAKATTHWSDWARTDVGARADGYAFDVRSDNPLNSGKRLAAVVSPKAGLVLGPWSRTEIYFNAGLGFHSNDARGATVSVDPRDGVTPLERVDPLVRSRGLETGVRTSFFPGFVSTVSLWTLDLDSELVFVGDAGGTEASGASRRSGIEFANFYRVNTWLCFDADVSFTRARYRESALDDHIANSIGTVVTAGVVARNANGCFASVRLRYFGAQPLIEDDSVREPPSTTINAQFGWRNRNWEVALSLLNALDARNDDISYFYRSRLSGEAGTGVDDIHAHPAEPRTVRVSLTRRF